MSARRPGITRALGGPAARRRRHRRVAALVLVSLIVAGWLLTVGDGGDDDTFAVAASALCEEYADRLQEEFQLSFPEGAPNPAAEAEYLSHAFTDTLDELVAELEALDPSGDAATAVAALADTSVALREDPSLGIGTDPFADEVRPRFDAAGIDACGSGFLATPA